MRVRPPGPLVLVIVALALPAAHAGAAPAATGPRERAALIDLFATDAGLARARASEQAASVRLASARSDLRSLRARQAIAQANQRAAQRALALRLNEIYRSRPIDTLGVLLAARSWSDISAGLDLLDRLSRSDSQLVRSARHWRAALRGQSHSLRTAEAGALRGQAAWEARTAELQHADQAQRALLARLRHAHVHALKALAASAHRDVVRAARIVQPQPHGGGSVSAAPAQPPATTAPAAPAPSAPSRPSLAAGSTLSVASTAYSLPGHTASGLPVGQGICATDPRVIPLGTRFDVPGYGRCVAADTGGSVVGRTIDIWMPSAQAAVYGSQTITITFR